jgi:hypothetical protein
MSKHSRDFPDIAGAFGGALQFPRVDANHVTDARHPNASVALAQLRQPYERDSREYRTRVLLLLRLIASQVILPSALDDTGLKSLFATLDPRFQPPCSKMIANAMSQS